MDGKDYHFMSEPEFQRQVANGEMLEHAHVFGNFYGSPRGPVQTAIDGGDDVLFDIDWQGAQQIQNSALGQHTLSIFILPPSIRELHRRLVKRGQDSAEVIERLKTVVQAARLKRIQQPGLNAHVKQLHTEFEETTL